MSYPYNPEKRAAMISGLAEWAGRYPAAAELFFESPEEYVQEVDNARSEIDSKYAHELSNTEYEEYEYWMIADSVRGDIVAEIKARFQLKAAE